MPTKPGDQLRYLQRLRPQPCERCQQPIDYDAEPDDPNGFTVETQPLSGRLRPAHRICPHDDDDRPLHHGIPSRNW